MAVPGKKRQLGCWFEQFPVCNLNSCDLNGVKNFPALLISLKFLKVKQAKVNRELTNNSETEVSEKFQFYKKQETNFDQNQ